MLISFGIVFLTNLKNGNEINGPKVKSDRLLGKRRRRMPRRLVLSRQREPKYGALGLVGRRQYPSAMGLDDRAADREPHAGAMGLGRIEGVEYAIDRGRIKPRTGITHFHEHITRLASAGDYRQLAR